MFEKILVPLDMSKLAEQALPPALELARAFNSELHLINVCEPPKGGEQKDCQFYIEDLTQKLRGEDGPGSRITNQVINGRPDRQIMEYAKSEGIKLIFMSSHGRSGVMLWPLGGTVDRVLRRTGIPLIIVNVREYKEGQPSPRLFEHILVTLDGSERGAQVLPYVREIARRLGPEVTLLHVIDTDRHVHNLGRVDIVPITDEEMKMLKEKAVGYLAQQSAGPDTDSTRMNTVAIAGNVAKEIVDYAHAHGTTLIAMSSHGHSGFEAWVIGSVTSKVLHAANKSVFFVPAIETQ